MRGPYLDPFRAGNFGKDGQAPYPQMVETGSSIWSPSSLSTIVLLDHLIGAFADGAKIPSWNALVGNNPTQVDSAKQPDFLADALNGMPGAVFTGASQDHFLSTISAISSGFCSAAVFFKTTNNQDTFLASAANDIFSLSRATPGARTDMRLSAGYQVGNASAGALTSPTLMIARYDGANIQTTVDGVDLADSAVVSAIPGTNTNLYLGQNGGGVGYFSGTMFWYALSDTSWTDVEVELIKTWIETTYSVTL